MLGGPWALDHIWLFLVRLLSKSLIRMGRSFWRQYPALSQNDRPISGTRTTEKLPFLKKKGTHEGQGIQGRARGPQGSLGTPSLALPLDPWPSWVPLFFL